MNLKANSLFAFTLLFLSSLSFGSSEWEKMQDINRYDLFALEILNWTHVFEARQSYVALTKEEVETLEFLKMHLRLEEELGRKEDVKPTRGIASEVSYHPGEESWDQRAYELWRQQQAGVSVNSRVADPAERLCQTGSSCLSEEQFYRGQSDREVARQHTHPGGFAGDPFSTQPGHSVSPKKTILDPRDGDFRYHGNDVIRCFGAGDCVVVGSTSEFEIKEIRGTAERRPRTNSDSSLHGPESHSSPNERESTSASALNSSPSSAASPSGYPSPSGSASTSPSGSTVTALSQVFQRCEERHQRALALCGSSHQGPNSEAVRNELNFSSGRQLASYLQYARVTSHQGKSMYEVCEHSEKMAKSMTALNAAYTSICTSAQNACATSCHQAERSLSSLSASDEDISLALNSTSFHFDPARMHRACKTDMNRQMQTGLFHTAQTAELMQAASTCKANLAGAGPCALPKMWNSQACYDFCQDRGNSRHPACARFAAMASNCANPSFAEQNSFCLCLNHPADPSCRGGSTFPADELAKGGGAAGGIIPPSGNRNLLSSGSGSFGQNYESGQRSSAALSSQAKEPEPRSAAGGPIVGEPSRKRPGREGPAQEEVKKSGHKTAVLDGVHSHGGGRRAHPQGKYTIYGDMNSKNPYRRITVESDDPNFDLKQYLPPEDFEAHRAPRCYRGKERIGCMYGPDLFEMVRRQYQKIRHEFME